MTSTTDPLDDLREAADILRGRSMCASAGPWTSGDTIDGELVPRYGDFGWMVSGPAGTPECEDTQQGMADALFIATMHPLVGVALADLFQRAADGWIGPGSPSEPAIWATRDLAHFADQMAVVRLARLVLGRADG
jgi:hypothetical protein